MNKKKNRWRAEHLCRYYYVYIDSYFNVACTLDCNTEYDKRRYDFFNYFQTKEEAQEFADFLKEQAKAFYDGKNN